MRQTQLEELQLLTGIVRLGSKLAYVAGALVAARVTPTWSAASLNSGLCKIVAYNSIHAFCLSMLGPVVTPHIVHLGRGWPAIGY